MCEKSKNEEMFIINTTTDEMKYEKRKQIVRYIGAALFIVLYIVFWLNKSYYFQISVIDEVSSPDYLLKRILFVTLICAGGIFLCLKKNKISDKLNRWISVGVFAVTPVVMFFAVEYANIFESRILWEVLEALGKKKSLTTVMVLLILMLGVYIISNSTKIAAILLSIAVCVFGVMCYFVYAFRGIPFLASDVTIMKTAFNVMANYEYELGFQPYILIIITAFWCVIITKTKRVKGLQWKQRIPIAVVYVIIFVFGTRLLLFNPSFRVKVNTFMPQKTYGRSGSVLTVIGSIRYILIDKPDGYSVDMASEIAEPYRTDTAEDTVSPNVIIIMDEAFADLQSLADFSTNMEVTPFFNNLKEDTVKGEMYVSVFGGQTANTEFEVLTGNSKAFLPASSTPYQMFIKSELPSLAYTLKRQDYQGNIAIHPYRPGGYNRNNVYPLLGFDNFLSLEDFTDAKLVRNFVSDEAQFDRVISEYEAAKSKSDAPFYVFNVTMQNHSSYDTDFDNLPKDIKITDEKYANEAAERYLNLIHLSDQALEQLVNYFAEQDDPTVIVFFGDHEPGLSNSFYKKLFGKSVNDLNDEELMQRYKVPYIIWANYDIEERENVTTSANYLSALMMESTKMKTTPYSRFLMETAKEVPALTALGYFGADGKYYKLDDKESPYYDVLNKYETLQYNNMFDKGKRIENFFD